MKIIGGKPRRINVQRLLVKNPSWCWNARVALFYLADHDDWLTFDDKTLHWMHKFSQHNPFGSLFPSTLAAAILSEEDYRIYLSIPTEHYRWHERIMARAAALATLYNLAGEDP